MMLASLRMGALALIKPVCYLILPFFVARRIKDAKVINRNRSLTAENSGTATVSDQALEPCVLQFAIA